MRHPHLLAGLAAFALLGSGLVVATRHVETVERRFVPTLAPLLFHQKNQGVALQKAAFRQPDLLPVYGSSELLLQRPYQRYYHANEVFRDYPTGFTIFAVGKAEASGLIVLQKLAAVGTDLRGKRVAIMITPNWFFNRGEMIDPASYAGNFSRLHATELAFSAELGFPLKHEAARRMLQYPRTVEGVPFLRFALERLAGGTPLDRALYFVCFPLGKLQCLILRLQDHWATLKYIRKLKVSRPPSRVASGVDWPSSLARAEREYQGHCRNNPFGFDDDHWESRYRELVKSLAGTRSDDQFAKNLDQALEWTDLDLLLRAVREQGGTALVLSTPLHGAFFDLLGTTAAGRDAFYRKLRSLTLRDGAELLDCHEFEGDRHFLIDYEGHLSPKGWICYDFVLDSFYHSRAVDLTPLAKLALPAPRGPAPSPPGAARLDAPRFHGSIDRVTCAQLAGWAWDKARPNTPISVEIYDDEVLAATVIADRPRKDLLALGMGDGRHGFVCPTPTPLRDGRPHTVRVRFSGTKTELLKSPRPIECGAAPRGDEVVPARR